MPDLRLLTPIAKMAGDGPEDTALLGQMARAADHYIRGFDWCPPVRDWWFADGLAGVVAVFLVRFRTPILSVDDLLWVIVGDLPSAYLVVDDADTADRALELYCELVGGWAGAVIAGGDLRDVFPVAAEASAATAQELMARIGILRDMVIPRLRPPREPV
jgi:hypothetical protein